MIVLFYVMILHIHLDIKKKGVSKDNVVNMQVPMQLPMM